MLKKSERKPIFVSIFFNLIYLILKYKNTPKYIPHYKTKNKTSKQYAFMVYNLNIADLPGR